MRLKVLVDNNTYIDEYYWGEPGVSYYIEDIGEAVLFDVGYSDLILRNAKSMNADLEKIKTIVLSHGHDDHTRGLKSFFELKNHPDLKIIAHPDAVLHKEEDGLTISAPFSKKEIENHCTLQLSKKPVKVSENITFLGEIPRTIDFERPKAIGKQSVAGKWVDDYLLDDSALVYQSSKGIYIITGCSHSGICNIIEHAKAVSGDKRVCGIIGGFHLFEVTDQVTQTIEYLRKNEIREILPCHCTSFVVKSAIHTVLPIREVGVGLELDW